MAFSDSGVRGYYDNGQSREGPWEGGTGPLLGNDLKEAMQDVDRLINIITLTDDDVEAQNRVVRSSYPADEHGPIPKVQFEKRGRSRRTRENREFLAERAAEIIRAAGAKKVYRMNWPPLILHVQSSMRMGEDPADSVLDENAEAPPRKAPVHRRQRSAAQLPGRPQPDPEFTGASHPHGGEDLPKILRRTPVRERRHAHDLHRRQRHGGRDLPRFAHAQNAFRPSSAPPRPAR